MVGQMTFIEPCLPQEYLRSGKTLASLVGQYNLTAKRHPVYPNLVQLKYSQIDSDFNDPLVRQCRGIILDEAANWSITARPFDKFGNVGESYTAEIDWKSATVLEKLDGSLMILYYYDRHWHVATSGTPDAGGEVNGYGMTFKDLFWDTFKAKKYVAPSHFNEHHTFLFELMTPYNRIVVRQATCDLKLIGVRNNLSGKELPVRYQPMFDLVKEYLPVDGLEALTDSFPNMDPLIQEGYVVVDAKFNRIKVKHPGYVALHHLRSTLSVKHILEVIRAGEASEVVASFPEWSEIFEQIRAAYDGLVMVLEQTWEEIKNIEPRKAYAIEACKAAHPGALFAMKDGKVHSIKEALRGMPIDKLVDLLGVKDIKMELTVV